MSEAMSITQAAARGISRLRLARWAYAYDYLEIDIVDGAPGPWVRLYSPMNQEMNGRDPVKMLGIGMDYEAEEWLEYTGILHGSSEYAAEVSLMEARWKKVSDH